MEILPYQVHSNKNILKSKGINSSPKASLLVGFYNNLRFFELIYASIESQTFQDFELIICDDGSKPEIVQKIHEVMKTSKILMKHVWHEDRGWHKNECLNKGILASESDYILFIDQDCVLHPEFIKEHYSHREKGKILAGRRLEFSPLVTSWLTPEKIRNHYIQKNLWRILPLIFHRKDNNGLKGIYIKNPILRKYMNRKHRNVVGCNFSLHKEDLLKVHGFDMRYLGAGTGEDSDIEYRLNLAGVKTLPFCNAAVQYHLYHPYQSRKNENETIFQKVVQEKAQITPFGINLISPEKIVEF